jgi:hypothetical protein
MRAPSRCWAGGPVYRQPAAAQLVHRGPGVGLPLRRRPQQADTRARAAADRISPTIISLTDAQLEQAFPVYVVGALPSGASSTAQVRSKDTPPAWASIRRPRLAAARVAPHLLHPGVCCTQVEQLLQGSTQPTCLLVQEGKQEVGAGRSSLGWAAPRPSNRHRWLGQSRHRSHRPAASFQPRKLLPLTLQALQQLAAALGAQVVVMDAPSSAEALQQLQRRGLADPAALRAAADASKASDLARLMESGAADAANALEGSPTARQQQGQQLDGAGNGDSKAAAPNAATPPPSLNIRLPKQLSSVGAWASNMRGQMADQWQQLEARLEAAAAEAAAAAAADAAPAPQPPQPRARDLPDTSLRPRCGPDACKTCHRCPHAAVQQGSARSAVPAHASAMRLLMPGRAMHTDATRAGALRPRPSASARQRSGRRACALCASSACWTKQVRPALGGQLPRSRRKQPPRPPIVVPKRPARLERAARASGGFSAGRRPAHVLPAAQLYPGVTAPPHRPGLPCPALPGPRRH